MCIWRSAWFAAEAAVPASVLRLSCPAFRRSSRYDGLRMTRIPILLSAGEASGDMYAARLAAALRKRLDAELFGMGGPHMRAAGVELVADYHEVSVVGITEIVSHLPSLVRAMRKLIGEAERRKPALAILTDFPGFHLRLARKLKPRGVRNVYFICPQFWAWRPWRANLIRRRFAEALCIFPFEEHFFRGRGVNAKFIGHPLAGEVCPALTRAQFAEKHGLDPRLPVVALLPGSRWGEISRHLPVMLEAARLHAREAQRTAQIVVAVAPGLDLARLRALIPPGLRSPSRSGLDSCPSSGDDEPASRPSGHTHPQAPVLVQGQTYDALGAADVSVVCSGTATVEAALLDAPMIVVYRLTALTAALAKPLVRTKFFSMVNLIAGHRVVPELVQDDFTPEKIAAELGRLLDPASAAEQRAGLAEVRRLLGPPGAIDRAADAIATVLRTP
ncbi:MAG TPA: hypothetical protein VFA13_02280 [Candidatus Acidoferrum sp.]|nr:hypothetical protein [Candidatus Acidoferrum sp.]